MPQPTTIRPEDPPTPANRRAATTVDWSAVFAAVAAGKGKWFRVAEYDRPETAKTSAIVASRRHDPAGRFELVSRAVKGVGVVYARLKTK